jgi:hypothetical protein
LWCVLYCYGRSIYCRSVKKKGNNTFKRRLDILYRGN